MFAVIKRYCIFHGSRLVGDIIETEKITPEQSKAYMVKITGTLPKTGCVTWGPTPALVVAHDLSFPRRRQDTAADDFTMLYRSPDGEPVEFWSITVSDGKKATLKTLTVNAAQKLYDKLPQRLISRDFLFSPAVYRERLKKERREQDIKKEEEADAAEARRREEIGPHGRFMEDLHKA